MEMLENLRKMIDMENEHDEMVELMIEATDRSIVDSFIEEDGEAEIEDSELTKILNNIPAYDEEETLNKKIKKITECYIPEDETLLESKNFKRAQYDKWAVYQLSTKSFTDLKDFTNKLEQAIEDDLALVEDAKDAKFLKAKLKWCVNVVRRNVARIFKDERRGELNDVIKELERKIDAKAASFK